MKLYYLVLFVCCCRNPQKNWKIYFDAISSEKKKKKKQDENKSIKLVKLQNK